MCLPLWPWSYISLSLLLLFLLQNLFPTVLCSLCLSLFLSFPLLFIKWPAPLQLSPKICSFVFTSQLEEDGCLPWEQELSSSLKWAFACIWYRERKRSLHYFNGDCGGPTTISLIIWIALSSFDFVLLSANYMKTILLFVQCLVTLFHSLPIIWWLFYCLLAALWHCSLVCPLFPGDRWQRYQKPLYMHVFSKVDL